MVSKKCGRKSDRSNGSYCLMSAIIGSVRMASKVVPYVATIWFLGDGV